MGPLFAMGVRTGRARDDAHPLVVDLFCVFRCAECGRAWDATEHMAPRKAVA